MPCPNCGATMVTHDLEGHLSTRIEIDLCASCQVFWFDATESPRLAPASTLKLFSMIAEALPNRAPSVGPVVKCPRCRSQLLETHDMQRNTRFSYRRCPHGHGRLTTFFDFLREKDFVRPLSGPQLDELRRHVHTVHCSNCGASVDLAHSSACGHCGSPLSILDMRRASEVIEQLRRAAEPKTPEPDLPLKLAKAKKEVEQLFATSGGGEWWTETMTHGWSGSSALAQLIRKLTG